MNLVPLFEEALEFQDYNGTVLSDGKVAVYYIGRTRLADIYIDVDGSVPAENPRILNNLGMGPVYVNPAFDYEMVVFDTYGSELFSVKKYLASKGEHSTANVVVTPSESIAVSAWTVGDVQVYMPYLTGQLGKVYEGIDPIVVNNQVDKISANHVPLGVQDPLYFVQDDEEGCILGFSGEALPEGTMNESAFGYQDGQITGYNGSAFSAGNTYEAGNYVDIDGNTINVTGLQPAGNYQSAGDYVVHDELSSYATQDWVENQSYMKEYMESAFYPSTSNPSGYLTAHQDISNKLDATAFSTVSGDFLTAIPSEYVTENTLQSGLSSKLDSTAFSTVSSTFLTAHQSLDGLMSASLLEQSGGLITGYNGTAFAGQGGVSGDFELSAGSGISIVDYPLEQKTVISVTAQGGNTAAEQAVIDNSATWNEVTAKADSTAIPSLDGYATEDWVTAQGYLTTAYNPEFAYHDTAISSIDNSALYDNSAHARINTLAGRISDLSSNKLDTTAFSDVSGTFLTAHQDISNKLDTTAFSDVSGSFLTAVPDTYLQNTDLTIVDNKITEISGIPLSAGDELPSGIMYTSGIEYDNTEISGYSGSAFKDVALTDVVTANSGAWGGSALPISAGPGVKFDMVDNTLVASTDETLLWSGNGTSITAFTASEPLTNFKEIVFSLTPGLGDAVAPQRVTIPMFGNNTSSLYLTFNTTWNGFTSINFTYKFNNTGMSAFSFASAGWFGFNKQGAITGNFSDLYGYEIYGVKRIAGGN